MGWWVEWKFLNFLSTTNIWLSYFLRRWNYLFQKCIQGFDILHYTWGYHNKRKNKRSNCICTFVIEIKGQTNFCRMVGLGPTLSWNRRRYGLHLIWCLAPHSFMAHVHHVRARPRHHSQYLFSFKPFSFRGILLLHFFISIVYARKCEIRSVFKKEKERDFTGLFSSLFSSLGSVARMLVELLVPQLS